VVAAGATVAVLGKHRAMELARTMKSAAQASADDVIENQKELKQQVDELRKSYPEKIAKLRNAIRTEEQNLAHVERDQEVCLEVLELCESDLSELKPQLESASIAIDDAPSAIRFRGRIYSINEAQSLAARAVETHESYSVRYNGLANEAELIRNELSVLNEHLKELRAEQEAFESEYRAIQREIDRIQHNKRLIKLAEERQSARNAYGEKESGKLASLSALRDQLSDVRTLQEEQLRALKVGPAESSYEDRARLSMHDASDDNSDN